MEEMFAIVIYNQNDQVNFCDQILGQMGHFIKKTIENINRFYII